MSNPYFQFKQFRIVQDNCAMKITTDACILAAWTPILQNCCHVLDIGTGTGILPLFLAQRNNLITIDAIEIDCKAAMQAKENVYSSPWNNRIEISTGDIRTFNFNKKYDLIITNPPFFNNSLLGTKESKNRARHTQTLTYLDIIDVVEQNLAPNGYLSILLPLPEFLLFEKTANENSYYVFEKLCVKHRKETKINRIVALFSKKKQTNFNETILVIKDTQDNYIEAFIKLMQPYYLNL